LAKAALRGLSQPFFFQEVKVGIQEFVMQERLRGDCYRLLAACFYYPRKQVLIEENFFRNLTHTLKKVHAPGAVFSERMEEELSRSREEDLLVDYAKLFVGPNELKAPPYGSVYLDNDRKIMGNSTMKVMELYRESGLMISDDFKELPDHVAVELEFMYYLAFKEAEAVEKSETDTALRMVRLQHEFSGRFLGRWIGPFCEKIKEGAETAFYQALAGCVSTFVLNTPIPDDIQGRMKAAAGEVSNSAPK